MAFVLFKMYLSLSIFKALVGFLPILYIYFGVSIHFTYLVKDVELAEQKRNLQWIYVNRLVEYFDLIQIEWYSSLEHF